MADNIQTSKIEWRNEEHRSTGIEMWYPVVEAGAMPRFRVERLGEGLMSRNWKASDLFLGQEVSYVRLEDALEWCEWQLV